MTSQISIRTVDRVMVLTLARPESSNRFTQQMGGELTSGLDKARRDPDILGCVLTGEGDVFCLGGEYWSTGPAISGRIEFGQAHADLRAAMVRLGKPLVAAVNGNAHAGGFALAVSCDLAYAADDATMGLPEAAGGLFPFLALSSVYNELPKKVLFDIVYSSRLMTTQEAHGLHLVNAVLPRTEVLPRAIEAVRIANSGNPDILRLGRDLYYAIRGAKPAEAVDQSRFALMAALSARDAGRESSN